MPADRRNRLLLAVWCAWAVVVLVRYYSQLLRSIRAFDLPSASATLRTLFVLTFAALLVLVGRRFAGGSGARRSVGGRTVAISLTALALTAGPWAWLWPRLDSAVRSFSLTRFPGAGEAVARAGIGIAGALLVATAAVAAGSTVLRIAGWRSASQSEQVAFAWATGVGVIAYGSLLLAIGGVYRPLPVALLVAALLLAGARRAVSLEPLTVHRPDAALSRSTVAWLTLIAAALLYALLAALAPEKEFDALWYHLYLPRVWLDAGHPVDLIEEYVSLYPLTWELVFGAGMVFGGVVAAKLLHFSCLPVIAALVWQAARRLGAPPAIAAACVVTTPTLLWEAGTTYVDLALALHATAACYALVRYTERDERGWGAVAALQFGLAAATKHLGVIITVIALGLFVAAVANRRRSLRPALERAAVIALIAALIPAPWYIRSWLASGNPVFPDLFAVFGATPPERWDALAERGLAQFKAHFGMGRTFSALLALPWNMTVHGASFGGSLGPLFLLFIPALLIARARAPLSRWLAAGVAAYLAVWASPVSSFQMRFLVPIVPPLALLVAQALDSLVARARSIRLAAASMTWIAVGLTALNLPPFVRFHEPDRQGWSGWLTHVLRDSPVAVVTGRERELTYLRRHVPSFAAWQAIDERLPVSARVLTFSEGDQFYSHRRRIPYHATMARTAVWAPARDVALAGQALRNLQVTHVLFDRRTLSRQDSDAALASPAFQQACVTEFDDGRHWLCRLDYSRLPQVDRPSQ